MDVSWLIGLTFIFKQALAKRNETSSAAVPSANDEVSKLQDKIKKQNEKCVSILSSYNPFCLQNEVDDQIKKIQEDILKERRNMNGITPQEKHAKLIKEIKNLENRLDKSNQKYNSTIAYNKNLREEIDTLRRERLVFEQIYSKLNTDLDSKKKEMEKIVKIAETANQDREQATNELTDLIKQAEEEKLHFDHQIAVVNKKIEQEKIMKEFMKAKENE